MTDRKKLRKLTLCAAVAALYAALTIVTAPFSYGPIQFRLSEAMVALCAIEPVLGIGITLGCFLANLFSTVTVLDAIVGTAATALACLWTARCKRLWLIPLPNVLINAVLVGSMLAVVLMPENIPLGFAIHAAQVGAGELAVMYILGLPLYAYVKKIDLIPRLLEDR